MRTWGRVHRAWPTADWVVITGADPTYRDLYLDRWQGQWQRHHAEWPRVCLVTHEDHAIQMPPEFDPHQRAGIYQAARFWWVGHNILPHQRVLISDIDLCVTQRFSPAHLGELAHSAHSRFTQHSGRLMATWVLAVGRDRQQWRRVARILEHELAHQWRDGADQRAIAQVFRPGTNTFRETWLTHEDVDQHHSRQGLVPRSRWLDHPLCHVKGTRGKSLSYDHLLT